MRPAGVGPKKRGLTASRGCFRSPAPPAVIGRRALFQMDEGRTAGDCGAYPPGCGEGMRVQICS
jgi:hypothetical protein